MTEAVRVYSAEAAMEVAARMEATPHVVPTGLGIIDQEFRLWGDRRGIPRGQYVLVAGASNAGKSRYGSRLLRNATEAGEPAALVSLEDSQANLLAMYFQQLGAIDWRVWLPSRWRRQDSDALVAAVTEAGQDMKAPLYVVSNEARSSLVQVLQTMEELVDSGVTFFVVDHIQLVKIDGVTNDYERSVAVSEAIRQFKAQHGVTVVGLSQLNRAAARERGRSPIIQDLHGGTSLESNADTVILLDHSLYEDVEGNSRLARTWFILGKNRLGRKDFAVPVEIDHATLSYRVALPDEEYLWPTHKEG